MTFQRVPNTVQVELVFLQQGQFVENVFHVSASTPPTISGMNTLMSTFQTWHNTHYKLVQGDQAVLVMLKASSLDSDGAPGVEASLGAGVPGTYGGQCLSNNVTLAIKWLTTLRGRSFRGRTYMIGLTSNAMAGTDFNHINVTIQASIATHFNALLTAINVGDQSLSVVSRRHGGLVRAEAVTTPISGLSVDSTLDSQRRRLPGRGS